MWINSLNMDGVFINNLYEDVKDGVIMLKVLDKMQPCVDWKKVENNPNNKFKKISNCNYAVNLAKNPFNFSMVNIGGGDINDGNKKLILGIVW